jgi:choline dehydrogenase-like flavoprotein
MATKEVILCCGAIDTPKLLLLNGIGPKAELAALGIEVKKDLPAVGKHLQDHVAAFMCVEVDGSMNDRTTFETDVKLNDEALEMWEKDQSGALSLQHSTLWGGFFKIPGLEDMPEFKELSKKDQTFLGRNAVPHFELIANCLLWPPGTPITPGNTYLTFVGALMNPQSAGSVTLRSKDPADKPVLQFNFLKHRFDALIMREIVRKTWNRIVDNSAIAPFVRKTLAGPASLSDAAIDAYCKESCAPVWHANGTVRMGKEDDGSCVDSSGKVYGVQGLRIADLSVCPLTTNNHTQATAYLVGQKLAEKMVREYRLDRL